MLVIQLVLSLGSYVTGCFVYEFENCSASSAILWTANHPVFSIYIVLFPLLGFILGAFGGFLPTMPLALKNIFGWIVVILLVAAFALWGLPNVPWLVQNWR